MIKVNVGISIALVISIFTCVVLTYFWIDRSISLGYMRQSYEMEKNSVKILQKLISLEWKGMPEEQLQARLESAAKEMTDADLDASFLLFSMWTEAIKHFGETGKGNVIFLDGSTDGMQKTMNQMLGMMKMNEKPE